MRSVRQFNVVPAVPAPLEALRELTSNLHWTWDRDTVALFERLDPAEWRRSCRDPLRLLAAIDDERWAQLAADADIVADVQRAADRLRDAIAAPRWFQGRTESPLGLVAYFSPEFGLSETLPQYSGGLGVLGALAFTKDNATEAARLLDLERGHFYKKMKALGLKRGAAEPAPAPAAAQTAGWWRPRSAVQGSLAAHDTACRCMDAC